MCLLARGVKYLLHNNNNYYYYLLIQCIGARINVRLCVCVCVFPCAKQRSTESPAFLSCSRERSDDNGRLLFRSLASLFVWNLRWSFSREFFFFVFTSFSFFFPSLSLSFFPREDEEEVIKRDFLDWCRVRKRVRMTVYDCKKTPQLNASRTNMVWLLTSRCSFFHLFLSPFFILYTYNILAFGEKQNERKREAEQRRGL